MDITIGVQHLARELVIESDEPAEAITTVVRNALTSSDVLELTDTRGRHVLVPVEAIGYVEIGPDQTRRVGFGSL